MEVEKHGIAAKKILSKIIPVNYFFKDNVMRNFLLSSLMILFFIPHCSFAQTHVSHSKMSRHHHAQAGHRHSKSNNTEKVDINTATASQLTTLVGIGQKKASEIVQYRTTHGNFKTINDLTKIKGFGGKTLAQLAAKNPGRIIVNKPENIG